MKKSSIITALAVSILLCSCSQKENDSKAPAATSAPETTASSQEESSIQTEEIPESDTKTGSLSDDELDRLSNIFEDFDTEEEFLKSDFYNKYYTDIDFGGVSIFPEHDENVTPRGVTAYYSCYYVYYVYKDKKYGICVSARYNKVDYEKHEYAGYDSTEDLYNELMRRNIPDTDYKYDKENDLIAVTVGYSDNEFIQKITPSGMEYDVFCIPDCSATLEEIIEFSKQLKF